MIRQRKKSIQGDISTSIPLYRDKKVNGTHTTTCSPGSYRGIFGVCQICPPGTFKSIGESPNTPCRPCGTNTFWKVYHDQKGGYDGDNLYLMFNANTTVATECACLDYRTQVFDSLSGSCICKEGVYLPNQDIDSLVGDLSMDVAPEAPEGTVKSLESKDGLCKICPYGTVKSEIGDSKDFCSRMNCPYGTKPNAARTSCVREDSSKDYDPITGQYICSVGLYFDTKTRECKRCPGEKLYKGTSGNEFSLCKLCPFGTISDPETGAFCILDGTIVNAVYNHTKYETSKVGVQCPAGTVHKFKGYRKERIAGAAIEEYNPFLRMKEPFRIPKVCVRPSYDIATGLRKVVLMNNYTTGATTVVINPGEETFLYKGDFFRISQLDLRLSEDYFVDGLKKKSYDWSAWNYASVGTLFPVEASTYYAKYRCIRLRFCWYFQSQDGREYVEHKWTPVDDKFWSEQIYDNPLAYADMLDTLFKFLPWRTYLPTNTTKATANNFRMTMSPYLEAAKAAIQLGNTYFEIYNNVMRLSYWYFFEENRKPGSSFYTLYSELCRKELYYSNWPDAYNALKEIKSEINSGNYYPFQGVVYKTNITFAYDPEEYYYKLYRTDKWKQTGGSAVFKDLVTEFTSYYYVTRTKQWTYYYKVDYLENKVVGKLPYGSSGSTELSSIRDFVDGIYSLSFPGKDSWCNFDQDVPVHSCEPCSDVSPTLFNPYNVDISNTSAPDLMISDYRMNTGTCYSCPDIVDTINVQTSNNIKLVDPFVSAKIDTLYINWDNIFGKDAVWGNNVTYKYALGSTPAGTQILPFTNNGNKTSVVINDAPKKLKNIQVATPIFLSVVSMDALGNAATYTDSQPVMWVPTGPIPGVAKEATLDTYVPPTTTEIVIIAPIGNFSVKRSNGDDFYDNRRRRLSIDGNNYRNIRRLSQVTESLSDSMVSMDGSLIVPNKAAVINADKCNGKLHCLHLNMLSNIIGQEEIPLPNYVRPSRANSITNRRRMLQYGTVPETKTTSDNKNSTYNWRYDTTLVDIMFVKDLRFQPICDKVNITFEAFTDPSGIQAYAGCLGTAPFICDLVPIAILPDVSTEVFTAQFITLVGSNLPRGKLIYGTIQAVSTAGQVASVSTNGVMCDDRAPLASYATVYDTGKRLWSPNIIPGASGQSAKGGNVPVDIDCDVEGSGIGAAWRDFRFFVSLDHYEWAIGTEPLGTNILDWNSVGVSTSAYNASIRVPAGVVAYVSVRAIDRAGQMSVASSDGVLILSDISSSMATNITTTTTSTIVDGNTTTTVTTTKVTPFINHKGTFVCQGSPSFYESSRTGKLSTDNGNSNNDNVPIGLDSLLKN